MKKLFTLLGLIPFMGLAQTTYIPDDAFEDFIETNFPSADNGTAGDDYVLTAGIVDIDNLSFSAAGITDLTGIGAFTSLDTLFMWNEPIDSINLGDLDNGTVFDLLLTTVNSLTYLELPHGEISLITTAFELETLIFQSDNHFHLLSIHNANLESIDISSLSAESGINMSFESLDDLTELNLSTGNNDMYGYTSISGNPLLHCLVVDDPDFCGSSADWAWDEQASSPDNHKYVTDMSECFFVTIEDEVQSKEEKLIGVYDLLGRTAEPKPGQVLIYEYSSGRREKKVVWTD